MFTIAPGTTTSIADAVPRAPFYHQVGGFLRDLFKLEFQVLRVSTEAEQVTPVLLLPGAPGRVLVDTTNPGGVDRLGYGRYAARFTVDPLWSTGRYVVRWFWSSTSTSTEQTIDTPFDVVAGVPAPSTSAPLYALPSDLRAEGVTVGMASDVRLYQSILLASKQFEQFTRQFFEPRYLTLALDGNGSVAVLLDQPIIALDELFFASITLFLSELPIDATAYRVYNRHLAGLMTPDDRLNPRLELYGIEDYVATWALQGARFPRGKQNVSVKGVFGFTDPDGSPFGSTPSLVNHAVKLLTLRVMRKMTSAARGAAFLAPFVTDEKTRDQSVSFARFGGGGSSGLGSSIGAFTGDPEIDGIIVQFQRPLTLGAI